MQRDLYHTGLAKFTADSDQVFRVLTEGADALESSPSMRLLDELNDYLVDSLYLRPDVACCESILAKILASKLCTGEIPLLELIEFDDQALIYKLQDAMGENPIAHVTRRRPIFSIRTDLRLNWFEAPDSLRLEMELLGIKVSEKDKLRTYVDEHGVVLSVYHLWDEPPDTSNFRIILNILQGNRKIRPLVAVVSRLRDKLGGRESEGRYKLAQEVLTFAFGGKRINYDESRVRGALLKMIDCINSDEANSVIWAVYDVLSTYSTPEGFPTEARRFWRMLQRPSRLKKRKLTGNELKAFWERMVPSLMSLSSSPNQFGKCWKPVEIKLRGLAKSGIKDGGEVIEALAYATELVTAKKGRPKWVLPSVRMVYTTGMNDGKSHDPDNEVDVVSVELLQNSVQIRLTECTKSASAAKATDDHRKLQRVAGILTARRFKDLEVYIAVVTDSKVGKDFVSIGRFRAS
jgi:hypothetical protein